MKKLAILFATLLLAGCSVNPTKEPPTPIQAAAMVTDSLTTYKGLSDGAVELNPLFDQMSPVNAALSGFAFSYGMSHLFPESRQLSCSFKWGATVNNIAVIAGASTGLSVGLGILSGFGMYELCAD